MSLVSNKFRVLNYFVQDVNEQDMNIIGVGPLLKLSWSDQLSKNQLMVSVIDVKENVIILMIVMRKLM